MPAVLAVTLLLPASAQAASAYVDGDVIHVVGTDAGDNLEVRYADAGGPIIAVQERFKTVSAGAGCSAQPDGGVTCPFEGMRSVSVTLGDGDDELVADVGLPLNVDAGAGNDRLTMRSGASPWTNAPVVLDGGDGDDTMAGGPGDDALNGGSGDDGMDGSGGNDQIDPGPGHDVVTDTSGDDQIEARDGDVDHVDCGAGTDTGDFDSFDIARGCELGNLPTPPTPDCTPEVDPVSVVAWSHLHRVRSLTIRATAEAGCVLKARIATGSGAVLATASAKRGSVRLALGSRALRRIRAARRFRVSILSTQEGTTKTIRRTYTVRVRLH